MSKLASEKRFKKKYSPCLRKELDDVTKDKEKLQKVEKSTFHEHSLGVNDAPLSPHEAIPFPLTPHNLGETTQLTP